MKKNIDIDMTMKMYEICTRSQVASVQSKWYDSSAHCILEFTVYSLLRFFMTDI